MLAAVVLLMGEPPRAAPAPPRNRRRPAPRPPWSLTMKQASDLSTDQGDGKRRGMARMTRSETPPALPKHDERPVVMMLAAPPTVRMLRKKINPSRNS